MARLIVRSFAALLLLAVGASTVACGGDGKTLRVGDGGTSLEDYSQRIEPILREANEKWDRVVDDFLEGLEAPSIERRTEAVREYFRELRPIMTDAVGALEEIEPPPEAAEAHSEFLAAAAGVAAASEDGLDRLAEVESLLELEDLLELDEAFATGADRVEAACLGLQRIADENGNDINLKCIIE